jgi:hypothetical protein
MPSDLCKSAWIANDILRLTWRRSVNARPPLRYVNSAAVELLAQRCGPRDWAIVETVNRLRLVTGHQLERYFSGSSAAAAVPSPGGGSSSG